MERGFEGAGLGLSICKGLAKYLNGDIWVDSEIDKGSSFYLKIPLKIGNQNITEVKKEKPHKVMNNNTILIAEDDDTSFSLLEMILKKENLQIIRACNGSEAVDIFRINHNIKCVLMDIKMPIMNGIEATQLIKSINPDIPVIAQTAYAFNIERQQVLSAGCNDYITKPISKKLLLLLLEKHLKNVS
jgi:CheY-like chemotaxis protein